MRRECDVLRKLWFPFITKEINRFTIHAVTQGSDRNDCDLLLYAVFKPVLTKFCFL
jgi:hypothetical protein